MKPNAVTTVKITTRCPVDNRLREAIYSAKQSGDLEQIMQARRDFVSHHEGCAECQALTAAHDVMAAIPLEVTSEMDEALK